MSIIYFDICAIPLFVMILFICYSRKMTKGLANRLFMVVVFLSLFSAVADLGMEITSNNAPLSATDSIICSVSTYLYLIVRNATNVVLLLFLLVLTRTSFLLRKKWMQILFSVPYLCILVLLAQNPFTNNVFTITVEEGYTRGPLMMVFYIIALIYGLVGLAYCIYCRRYLPLNRWIPLLSIYVLNHVAVLIQFLRPGLLLEMFCTAMGALIIMFSVMRPEERMDSEVGMLSWASYQSDLRNVIMSGEQVKITAIRMVNSREIRNYMGDQEYNQYLMEIANEIRTVRWKRPHRVEIYYERPGMIYLITDAREEDTELIGNQLHAKNDSPIARYEEIGVRFEPQVLLIRCPDDLRNTEDIISLGHNFQKAGSSEKTVFLASEIVHSKHFTIGTRIAEILDRAIKEDYIEIYYQPIYNIRTGKFSSAEALARINDPEFGMISPGIFIPEAETRGYIIPIGDRVLELVFRFLSEIDPDSLGLSYIEVNLSVAQCMERSLPEKIGALQEKYGVDPSRINLEITETTFENISDIMMENTNKLIEMGYSFSLDDYGIGYSSIQRVNRIPMSLIKIDKSMVDEIDSVNGQKILSHTVQMMQSIGKHVVAEGAETSETVDDLKNMNCDYIQGFYFSRPLPEAEFLRFLEENNGSEQESEGT